MNENEKFHSDIKKVVVEKEDVGSEKVEFTLDEAAASDNTLSTFLETYLSTADKKITSADKKSELQDLVAEIEAEIKLRKRAKGRTLDLEKLLQMIDGEIQSLDDPVRLVENAAEAFRVDLETNQDNVTYLKDVQGFESNLKRINSLVDVASRLVVPDKIGAEEFLTQSELLESVKYILLQVKELFFSKRQEKLAEIYPAVQQFNQAKTSLETALANPATTRDELSQLALLLITAQDAVNNDPDIMVLPAEYMNRVLTLTNIEPLKRQVLEKWQQEIDTRWAAKKTNYETRYLNGTEEITDVILNTFRQEIADEKTNLAGQLANLFDLQIAYWEQVIKEMQAILDRMIQKKDLKFQEAQTVDGFLELLAAEEDNPPKKLTQQEDKVEKLMADIKKNLESLKEKIAPSEYTRLQEAFFLFQFRYTKKAILNQTYSDIINASSHTTYVGKAHEALFENKLLELVSIINDFERRGKVQLAREMRAELKRFKDMFAALRLAFYAGATLEPQIIGSKDSTAGAQRKIPLQSPDWFPSTADLIYSLKEGTTITANPELLFRGEKPYNETCPPRFYKVPDFDNPGRYKEKRDYEPNVRSDCRRILDMIARNTLKNRLKSKIIREERRTPTREEQEIIDIVESEDLFRSVHMEEYNQRILPKVLMGAAKILYGDEVSFELARTVWYEHILFLNFSAMAPGSPSTDDQIYKTFQPIRYIAEGALAGTTSASPVHMAFVVGVHNPSPEYAEQGGVAYVLDRFVVRQENLSDPHNLQQDIGMRLSGVIVEEGDSRNREKVIRALQEEHLFEEFGFLADLPFMVSYATVWKTIPFVPSPLQFMVFRNPGGPVYPADPAKPNADEVPILRWGGVTDEEIEAGAIPRPITAADFVTPVEYYDDEGNKQVDYDMLYEMLPLDALLESTALTKWYNNGKNIEALRAMIYNPSSKDIFDPTKVAALQNEAKYVAVFLPDEIGTNVSAGTFASKKVFQRFTIVSVFARCIDLLTSSDLTLEKVEEEILKLMRVLGEGAKNSRAMDAILVALKQLVGTEEEAQQTAQRMLDQISKSLGYQH